MKTKRMIFFVIAIFACTVFLTGCKSNFGIRINEDNSASIEAVRASKGSFGGAGTLEVGEGQKIVVQSGLKGKSEISLKFTAETAQGKDLGIADLGETISGENAVLEIIVKGSENAEYDLAPGFYFLAAKVIEKANGTVLITVH